MAAQAETTIEVRDLTEEQASEVLDALARRYLDMSGAAFIQAWDAGEFNGDSDRPAVVRLAMLLPLGR